MGRPKVIRPALFVVIAVVIVGLFLRLYNRHAAMYYMNDQGHLLLVAHEINNSGHVPLAGPRITIAGVSIPPINYYLVSLFERLGSDPLMVSLGYISMGTLGSVALWRYGMLVFGASAGFWTLFVLMLSSSAVEQSRSIWEPHPMIPLIAFYLLLTELGFLQKNPWLMGAGILSYVLSATFYPAPILLLPYVIARTAGQLHMSKMASIALVGGMAAAVFVPWIMATNPLTFYSQAGETSSFAIASVRGITEALYANVSTLIHDTFGLSVALPQSWVGALWLKAMVFCFVALSIVSVTKQEISKTLKFLTSHHYHWLVLGFLVPALIGMKLMPHRLLPFYPFFFLTFGQWISVWISGNHRFSQAIILLAVGLFIVGNMKSWYVTTIKTPRNDYTRTTHAVETIVQDMAMRRIPVESIGVHYFRPDDQYDFFGAHLYYLLRLRINYPVSFPPLGNELLRGKTEEHAVAYLVCDGFLDASSGCIQPFATRWPYYTLAEKYRITEMESVYVFERI